MNNGFTMTIDGVSVFICNDYMRSKMHPSDKLDTITLKKHVDRLKELAGEYDRNGQK